MENKNDKTIRYLRDLHAAESGTSDIFEGHARDNDTPNEIRMLAQQALDHTKDHRRQIEARIQSLGGSAGESGLKDFVNNLLAKGSDLLNIGHDNEDKLTQDLIKAYAALHLHVGAYESLRAYTTTIGDSETAALAANLGRADHELAERFLQAIGRAAPEAAAKTDGGPTTDGTHASTGVNRDLDANVGANVGSSSTTHSAGTEGGSGTNPSEYRDPNSDPALRITNPNVPGGMPNYDPTNPPATPENPQSGTRML